MAKFQKGLILVMVTLGVNITTTRQGFFCALVYIPAWEADNSWLSIEVEKTLG